LIGMDDYYTGIVADSLTVETDFAVNGAKAGENLGSKFQEIGDGIFELKLQQPLPTGKQYSISVSVRDREGNVTRLDREFSVGQR
jgi:hypothetical protein